MKIFLNREMDKHRNLPEKEVQEMRESFEKSAEMAYMVFGKNAFRRFNVGNDLNHNGVWEARKLNLALWDTILYSFSFYEKHQIVPIIDRIREEFLDVMTNDQRFVDYITSSTDLSERIQCRANTWQQRLQNLIGNDSKEPRAFSQSLKKQLFETDPTCKICGQSITDLDDAEVDHIVHYWRGGKTIEDNARLTHRYCNRVRGGRD